MAGRASILQRLCGDGHSCPSVPSAARLLFLSMQGYRPAVVRPREYGQPLAHRHRQRHVPGTAFRGQECPRHTICSTVCPTRRRLLGSTLRLPERSPHRPSPASLPADTPFPPPPSPAPFHLSRT